MDAAVVVVGTVVCVSVELDEIVGVDAALVVFGTVVSVHDAFVLPEPKAT